MFSTPVSDSRPPEFKIVVVGDPGVGKTSFIDRIMSLEPPGTTDYAKIYPKNFYTTHGPVNFKLWDADTVQELKNHEQGFFDKANGAIIMFDLTSKETYKNVPKWFKTITRLCDEIPTVVLGNKADVKEHAVNANKSTFQKKMNLTYFDLSAKANYHIEKPYLNLMRKLVDNNSICLVEMPAFNYPEIGLIYSQVNDLEARADAKEDGDSLSDTEDQNED